MGSSDEELQVEILDNMNFTRLSSESPSEDGVDLQDEDAIELQGEDADPLHEIELQGEDADPLQGEDSSHLLSRWSLSNEDKELMEELKFGMEFSSDESAYKAYVKYGGKNGFNVRKQRRNKNSKGFVSRLIYCCSKEGHRRKKQRGEKGYYSLPISRVGCEAHMTCQLKQNGKFKIVSFNASHNHELMRTPTKHMVKINRRMSKAQKAHANDAEKSGISVKASMELMSREVRGRENLGFIDRDYRNYIHTKRRTNMEKGDAGAILQYFQKMKVQNSSYFYAIQLDEDDMITNIFWADTRSVSDYALYGDVLCFDTTYRTNEYGRPFAPLIGVNHHKQSVLFGAALLYDETIESFKWLFETFLEAMSGKHPKTILTDQSPAMARAIAEIFPQTYHRLCVWHIYQNAAKNLNHVFHASKGFAEDFGKCVYEHEEEDEWLLAWNHMLEKYDLKENKWLKDLFDIREKWALVYGRHTFSADMMSTQRSESMNNILKNYLMPSHDLLSFFEHYERVLEDRRYEELVADIKMMQNNISTDIEMLEHAAGVYTPEVFRLFENEYSRILNYNAKKVSKSGTTYEYKVSYRGRAREHVVNFDASTQTITCSCMKFSFVGILCRHALKVLDKKNVRKIPPNYILKRWTREAKARSIINYRTIKTTDNNPKEHVGKRYSHLCRNFHEIASFAAEHEKLTAYAHECSIDLLQNLEKMKKEMEKDLFQENICVNQDSEGEAFHGESGGTGQVKMKINNCALTKARGVKRKAPIDRPLGNDKFKNPLWKHNNAAQSKATEAPTRKKLFFEATVPISGNSSEQHASQHGSQILDVMTQESAPISGNQNVQQGIGHGGQMHDVLTQGFSPFHDNWNMQTFIGHKGQMPVGLTQEALMHRTGLSQSKEAGKDLGS